MTKGLYNWNATGYSTHSSPQKKWAAELVGKLNLQGNERVLDIGCGDGMVTVEIARGLSEGYVIGIDSSEAMVNLARTSHPDNERNNFYFQQTDARNLPFENDFDVVFSNAALHWIKGHKPVLQGISRSLKAGGKVLLQMGGEGNGAGIFQVTNKVILSEKWKNYFKNFSFPYGFYGQEEYREWLKMTSLHPIRAELIPKEVSHVNPGALADWLQNVFLPYTEQIPEAMRRDFIEDVVGKYLQYHPQDERGCVLVHMVRLEVEARKVLSK